MNPSQDHSYFASWQAHMDAARVANYWRAYLVNVGQIMSKQGYKGYTILLTSPANAVLLRKDHPLFSFHIHDYTIKDNRIIDNLEVCAHVMTDELKFKTREPTDLADWMVGVLERLKVIGHFYELFSMLALGYPLGAYATSMNIFLTCGPTDDYKSDNLVWET